MSDINKIRVEESQLLWWLTTGWNSIKNCSYKSMSKEEACLFIGYEMAELVQVFPGPYSADGIIFRMIELCKGSRSNVTFADIVQAIPADFSEMLINQYTQQENLKLLPISMAIKYARNTTSTDEWSNKYMIESKNVDIVNKKLPPAEFAKQLFFEILTQRCLNAIDE